METEAVKGSLGLGLGLGYGLGYEFVEGGKVHLSQLYSFIIAQFELYCLNLYHVKMLLS